MKVLVTGGAGFIGSNLVKKLLEDETVEQVKVIDNLLTGFEENIEAFKAHAKFEFHNVDIRDADACLELTKDITHISHQAALGSVPRSVKDPIKTNDHNINGTLNILNACRQNKIERLVFASSSSVYGDEPTLPKLESRIGNVLSPYALTKRAKEEYARLFSENYGVSIIGLRYFNVFGPHQSPKGAYAAVIPLFIDLIRKQKEVTIHGDGEQSRDFTFIDNVVSANILALKKDTIPDNFRIYNIALGGKLSVNQLYQKIADILGSDQKAVHGPNREGDIKHSLANIDKITSELNYKPLVSIDEGLKRTVEWFIQRYPS